MLTLSVSNGDLNFRVADGLESVIQRVLQRLRFFRGSWFLNALAGVPHLSDVFGHQFDPTLAERTLTDAILSVDDVESVRDLEFLTGVEATETLESIYPHRIIPGRPLRFRATVETPFGPAEIAADLIA